ncbi:hypothetical protein KbCgl_07960 [Corynebacterium glutamicum]|nr:hypothetical protein KbCgl_07960 [Corynebacterium glutamicum]
MDLIIPRRSSYCPNFATAPDSAHGDKGSFHGYSLKREAGGVVLSNEDIEHFENETLIVEKVLLQLGAGAKKAPFLLCDQRYVPVLSGRLEYPANNHCIRIRVTIGKHRALPLPQ